MRTFRKDEIMNKHGQAIYLETGMGFTGTDYDKYMQLLKETKVKHVVRNIETYKCVSWENGSSHPEDCGYYLTIFNDLDEKIHESWSGAQVENDKEEVKLYLTDMGFL